MAELDDSIAHLRSFIGALTAARAEVDAAGADLDEQAADLGRLESAAGETIGELVETLETFSTELQEGEGETVGQLDRVADEGQRTAGERLGELARELEQDQAELVNVVQVGRDDLDKDHTGLMTSGFELASTAFDAVAGELGTAQQAMESSFATFEGAAQGLQQIAETGFAAGSQAVEAAAAALTAEGTQVATQAAEDEAELQGRARQFEADCGDVGDGLDAAYGTHGEAVETAAQDLLDSVHRLAEDTAAFVATSSADQLDTPVGTLMAEAMPPLDDELEQLQGMLADADQTAGETDALCSELQRCQRVVEEIDQVLNAME